MAQDIYNISVSVNDFLSSLLVFIIFFKVLPEARGTFNYLISIPINIAFTTMDIFKIGKFEDLSGILLTVTCILLIRSKRGFTIDAIVWIFSAVLAAFSQSISILIILSIFPELSHPNLVQTVPLFVSFSALTYIMAFMFLLILKLINKKFHLTNFLKDPIKRILLLISLLFIFLAYCTLDQLSKNVGIQITYIRVTVIVMTVTMILVSIGITTMFYGHIKVIKSELQNEQLKERDSYITELEKNNDELRKFKHDYKNILLSLLVSLDEKNNNDTSSLVKNLLNYKELNLDSNVNKTRLYKINDKLVKGIIVSKLIYAKSKNIKTDFEVDEGVPIPQNKSVEITRILGILLDNAIDACLQTDEPQLNFALISFDGYIEFLVKNNVAAGSSIDLNKIYSNGYSTKKKHSGLGLSTVKEVVDSNDNFLLQTKIKDGYFTTILTVLEDE